MKTATILFFLGALFLIACKGSGKEVPLRKIETIKDTMANTAQSLSKNTPISGIEEAVPTPSDCGHSFDAFFERFTKDSVFQKSRVKYPLKWYYLEDNESSKMIVGFINKPSEYNYIDFSVDKDAMNNEYDKYSISIEDLGSTVNYILNGYDNGINIKYIFKKINYCWLLVEIEDKST